MVVLAGFVMVRPPTVGDVTSCPYSRCIFGWGQKSLRSASDRLRFTTDTQAIVRPLATTRRSTGRRDLVHLLLQHDRCGLRVDLLEHTARLQRNSLTAAVGCGPVRSGCGFISTLAHPGGDRVAACADRPHRLPNRVADQLAAAHRWHFGQRCTRPDQGNLGAPRAGAARPSPALRCESATRSNVGQTGMFFTDLNESGHAGWSVAGTADPGEDRDLPFVVLFVQYVKAVDRFDD